MRVSALCLAAAALAGCHGPQVDELHWLRVIDTPAQRLLLFCDSWDSCDEGTCNETPRVRLYSLDSGKRLYADEPDSRPALDALVAGRAYISHRGGLDIVDVASGKRLYSQRDLAKRFSQLDGKWHSFDIDPLGKLRVVNQLAETWEVDFDTMSAQKAPRGTVLHPTSSESNAGALRNESVRGATSDVGMVGEPARQLTQHGKPVGEETYILGELLHDTTQALIHLGDPDSVIVVHRPRLDDKKAPFLYTRVALDGGKQIWSYVPAKVEWPLAARLDRDGLWIITSVGWVVLDPATGSEKRRVGY